MSSWVSGNAAPTAISEGQMRPGSSRDAVAREIVSARSLPCARILRFSASQLHPDFAARGSTPRKPRLCGGLGRPPGRI